MSAFLAIIRRDLLLVMRRKSEVLTILFFFVIVTSLFPLGIGADTALLRKIAPGVIWVTALLSTMLGLQRLFATDFADGTLEQMALSPTPLALLVGGKIAAHWLVCGLPLALLAPVIGIQFDLDASTLGTVILTTINRYTDFVFDWSDWRCIDSGCAWWWRLIKSFSFTSLHSGAHFWRWCCLCAKCWT